MSQLDNSLDFYLRVASEYLCKLKLNITTNIPI